MILLQTRARFMASRPASFRVTDMCSGLAVVLPAPPVGTGGSLPFSPVGTGVSLPFPPGLGEHDAQVHGEALSSGAQRIADLAGRRVI